MEALRARRGYGNFTVFENLTIETYSCHGTVVEMRMGLTRGERWRR